MPNPKQTCEKCGSRRITDDGDYMEPAENPDHAGLGGYYYGWWQCEDCGHQWRYQDDALNPGGAK